MVLPRAMNGMHLVCSIVCNFNGIVIFKSSNVCINFKVSYLEDCLTHFQNFPESNIASIRQKSLVLTCQCQGQVVNLKKLTQSHHSQKKEHFNSVFYQYIYQKDNCEGSKQ